jgi:hypothetical protein
VVQPNALSVASRDVVSVKMTSRGSVSPSASAPDAPLPSNGVPPSAGLLQDADVSPERHSPSVSHEKPVGQPLADEQLIVQS